MIVLMDGRILVVLQMSKDNSEATKARTGVVGIY
jgi:hypothetical protein